MGTLAPMWWRDRCGPTLLGRAKIRLDWAGIKTVENRNTQSRTNEVFAKYPAVFSTALGQIEGIRAHLSLKEGTQPRFCHSRSGPYAIKEQVGKELEEAGILQRVDYAEWAAPIVSVPNKDGSIRICGNYKVTINPVLQVDQYRLPKPTDLMACLTGNSVS